MCTLFPIRLQDFLMNNISWNSRYLRFLRGNSYQRKVISVVYSQVFLLLNWSEGVFDYQYDQKESINTLNVFHGYNHQGKVASKTNIISWCGLLCFCPIRFWDSLIINICERNPLIAMSDYCHFISFCIWLFPSVSYQT